VIHGMVASGASKPSREIPIRSGYFHPGVGPASMNQTMRRSSIIDRASLLESAAVHGRLTTPASAGSACGLSDRVVLNQNSVITDLDRDRRASILPASATRMPLT